MQALYGSAYVEKRGYSKSKNPRGFGPTDWRNTTRKYYVEKRGGALPPRGPTISLTLLELTGASYDISLPDDSTVSELVLAVCAQSGAAPETVQLTFGGALLSDRMRPVGEYGVGAGATVNVMAKAA